MSSSIIHKTGTVYYKTQKDSNGSRTTHHRQVTVLVCGNVKTLHQVLICSPSLSSKQQTSKHRNEQTCWFYYLREWFTLKPEHQSQNLNTNHKIILLTQTLCFIWTWKKIDKMHSNVKAKDKRKLQISLAKIGN